MAKLRPVQSQVDFPKLEEELLAFWEAEGIVDQYLHKNDASQKRFSFLDGPMTANNPMGVHHAWGRTYKDLWQRFYTMRGYKGRYQNGFDEQGLWVEVEVEKELGLQSKRDIENLVPGDKFASLEKFVNLCKERVQKFGDIISDQSKRLAYFMDWEHSYHTSSDENNYAIWNFLKVVHEKGWLYKGRDSVPWCPRCGTAISQHEISTEEYKELTHTSVFLKLPIVGREKEYLLVWTTTPWTIPGNVAVGINPEIQYVKVRQFGETYYLAKDRAAVLLPEPIEFTQKIAAQELLGLHYQAPFDDLDHVKKALGDYQHTVVDAKVIVTANEGTGLLHLAPGAGEEDFQYGKANGLPVIDLIDESASYLTDLGQFANQNAKQHPEIILDYLQDAQQGAFVYTFRDYQHRYPVCWRCKSELVWRVVDEWYIAMDTADDSGKTYREQMVEVAKTINWMPTWGLARELDWLNNMHDWLISKKRYWGLALPIWECADCQSFMVVGSKDELQAKATAGWDAFAGHTPHRPWIDQVVMTCEKCGKPAKRIPDVGNPWLDAGIVPISTLPEGWFPADFVTENFAGQFRNWFYALIAMTTGLRKTAPFKNLLGHGSVRDEKGEEMHKSKGNSINFNDAATEMGVDVMRWMYVTQNPENNLNFGYHSANEIRRRFYLILWNSYKFYVDYASIANMPTATSLHAVTDELTALDRFIVSRLHEVTRVVTEALEAYDATTASRAIESFVVADLSTWYIRRSRDRVGIVAQEADKKVALSVLGYVLVTTAKLLAPFMPFISEEMYRNLTQDVSVHLTDYPEAEESMIDQSLIQDMQIVRDIVEAGHAARKNAGFKLRQPLAAVTYHTAKQLPDDLEAIITQELNVKTVQCAQGKSDELGVTLNTNLTDDLIAEGKAREIIRQIQILRKEAGTTMTEHVKAFIPEWPPEFEKEIKTQALVSEIEAGSELRIERR